MLFGSAEFLFAFLPIALCGYWVAQSRLPGSAKYWWLIACSLFFYAWWEPKYLPLILISIAGNFFLAEACQRVRPSAKAPLMWLGVVLNLGLLGYYKYFGFLLTLVPESNLASRIGHDIVLPLGISFFTFQFVAIWGIHFCLFAMQLGVPTESSRWVYEAYEKKERACHQAGEGKILIVAGSNALFSISAELIERSTKRKAVNLGVHAGLKLEFALDRAIRSVGKNDLVLLPLEYSAYDSVGQASDTLVDFVLARDPSYLLRTGLADTVSIFAFESPLALLGRMQGRWKPPVRRLGYYDASLLTSGVTKQTPCLLNKRTRIAGFLLRAWRNALSFRAIRAPPRCSVRLSIKLVRGALSWCLCRQSQCISQSTRTKHS